MRKLCLAFLMAFAAPAPAFAQAESEVVFVGELRSLTLTRRDYEAEQRAERGRDWIIVSNSCGTASTRFRVIRSHSRMPREVQTTNTIGEWCEPPLAFGPGLWLVAMESRTRELLASYEIIEQQGAAYAIVLESAPELARRSLEVQRMLELEPLPEPIEFATEGFVPEARLAEWVSRHPALEMRDGKVWIVRAVPLARVFPGFSTE